MLTSFLKTPPMGMLVLMCTLLIPSAARGQLLAPGRHWAGITSYALSDAQDSIFAYHGTSLDTAHLRAQHSTGQPARFEWLRYSTDNNSFAPLRTDDNQTLSALDGLSEGGYRVRITSQTDSVEVFTVWLFADDVRIDTIEVENECDFMRLSPRTRPNRWDVDFDRFVYYDLSRPRPIPNNTFGRAYFGQVSWESSTSEVELTSPNKLDLTETPAPLHDASYTVRISTPFGRTLIHQTPELTAVAVKADHKVRIMQHGAWEDHTEDSEYEALLELELQSSSTNADLERWRIQAQLPPRNTYHTIWSDSTMANHGAMYPDKSKMLPGRYCLIHTAQNVQSGCTDSSALEIQVDSSMIKEEAIPNVFTPTNADGQNDVFRFVNPEQNIRSMQSCLIRIYNRSGKLMHSYEGPPRTWEGWDGRTHGRMAQTGVYYYIIECKGWDGQLFKRGPYKGFLYLY